MTYPNFILDRLADPILLLSATGETLYQNRACTELAARVGVPAQLDELFGPPGNVLLTEARRSGVSRAHLPLVAGEDLSRGFRITVQLDASDGTLAVQLTDFSEEAEWREHLFRRNRELTVLNDIGAALSRTLNLEELADRILDQSRRIMDMRNFFLALHDREHHRIEFPVVVEDGRRVGAKPARAFANGLTEHVMRTKQALLLNSRVTERLEQLGIDAIGPTPQSWLGVPLMADGEALGAIVVQDFESAGCYQENHLELLNIIASQAAAAIKNAQLFEFTRRAFQELSEAQAQMIESERLRGVTETVGALNHEVNNPLAAIVATAQLLLRTSDSLGPDVQLKVQRMLEAAQRIQQVTGKMSSLIQANSRPYPGFSPAAVLDVAGSIARRGRPPLVPGTIANTRAA